MEHALLTLAAAACETDAGRLCLDSVPHTAASQTQVESMMQIVFGVLGVLAVLMITIGGLRYVVSRGDPQAIAKAKHTIFYALIGLVVAMAAELIVIFVVGNI